VNLWHKLNSWLEWRGLTWNEVGYALTIMLTLIGAVSFLTWAVIQGYKPYAL
jgi:hypothetical protein